MTDPQSAELVVLEPQAPLALFGTNDPLQVIAAASRVATSLATVVNERKLYAIVNGKKFPTVEAWTLLGSMLGVFPITEWVHELHDDNGNVRGFEARVVAKTFGGRTVGAGEARCIRGESKTWHQGAQEFALASMAQTRATSKALRGPLDFVFKLAGFQPTPAEEMTSVVDQDGVIANPSSETLKAAAAADGDKGGDTQRLGRSEAHSVGSLPTKPPLPPPGPRAKRGNVVIAPQGVQSERSEVESQVNKRALQPPEVASGGQKVTSAMTSAPPVRLDDEPDQDGREEYRNSLREQAREAAAVLRQLRVRSENVRNAQAIALGTMQAVPLPPATPSTGSDESLQAYITARGEKEKGFKGQTLATLGEPELELVVEALEDMTAKVAAKLQ